MPEPVEDINTVLSQIGTLTLEQVNDEIANAERRLGQLRTLRRVLDGGTPAKRSGPKKSGGKAGTVRRPNRTETTAGVGTENGAG